MANETVPQESIPQTLTPTSAQTTVRAGSRVLHVGRSGLTYTYVLDSDKATYLYIIDTNHGCLKNAPDMSIKSAATSAIVGTITGYALSKNIDLIIHNKSIRLEALSALSTGRVFSSDADPGRRFMWTFDNAVSHNLACVDEKKKTVATWEGSSVLTRGENYFTIEPEIEGELLDEILVSGLAMVEHRAKRNRHGFGGAVCSLLRVASHPFKSSGSK